MPLPTFNPTIGPSFPVPRNNVYRSDIQRTAKGYETSRPLGIRSIQALQLQWAVLKKPELDEILSFFDSFNGANGPFYYTPIRTVTGPEGLVVTVSQVTGGSLASQSPYYTRITWYDSTASQETTGSAEPATPFTVSDNKLLTVTVPVFPLGVSKWRVYVGTAVGDAELQAGTEATRTWTMPVGGIVTGTANPPTANNLAPVRIYTFSALKVVDTLIAPGLYALQVTFNEQTAVPE